MTAERGFPRAATATLAGAPQKVATVPCTRCGGAGGFTHWPGFTCFRCGGNRVDPTDADWAFPEGWTDAECAEWTQAREDRLAAAREKRAAKAEAKRNRVRDANFARFPELVALWQRWQDGEELPPITTDILARGWRCELTEKQVDLALRLPGEVAARDAERAAADDAARALGPLTGRQRVEATVVKTEWRENAYGGRQVMTVKLDDGRLAWGTAVYITETVTGPDGEEYDGTLGVAKGDRIAFTATFEAGDDALFGFFKRPAKPEMIEQAPAAPEEAEDG